MNDLQKAVLNPENEEVLEALEDEGGLCDYLWGYEEDVDLVEGRIKFVETYRTWPMNDPMVNVVVEFGGVHYQNSTYYDSWNGYSDWDDSDWTPVEKVTVTKEEWKEVK